MKVLENYHAIRITKIEMAADRASANITLEDGRQVRVDAQFLRTYEPQVGGTLHQSAFA